MGGSLKVKVNDSWEYVGGGGGGPVSPPPLTEAPIDPTLTGFFRFRASGGTCHIYFDISRVGLLTSAEAITTLPEGARPPVRALLLCDFHNGGSSINACAEPDGTVHVMEDTLLTSGLYGNGSYGVV